MDTVQLVVVAEVTVGVVLCGPRDKHVDVAARGGEARGEAAEGNKFTHYHIINAREMQCYMYSDVVIGVPWCTDTNSDNFT